MTDHKAYSPSTFPPQGLIQLQAVTCRLMLRYTHHASPYLASTVARYLRLLSEHPVVQNEPECRATYLHLLDDWQRLTLGRSYSHEPLTPVSMKPGRH
ncbi:hypothetical protein [Nitrosococcus watsonii]|uniref:Uncharacterized protein n=1 Tax=Nitrosococcus watsoni (strain C-113) TaxID=105559 RepID=D8K8F7_NITWC|nr:hypothetical protein [Nitrosococcus watsonii]ADJ29077.1 conserved hypothetical protein [Nitrosococcus watsonii C-113]